MPLGRPRFRRDLEAVPVDADGQRYVEIRDPSTGGSFRFYDFEYRVALAFDGLAADNVIPWLKLTTGMDFRVRDLEEFAARLRELGFLEPEPEGVAPAEVPAAIANVPVPTRQVATEVAEAYAEVIATPTETDETIAAPSVEASAKVEPAPAESPVAATVVEVRAEAAPAPAPAESLEALAAPLVDASAKIEPPPVEEAVAAPSEEVRAEAAPAPAPAESLEALAAPLVEADAEAEPAPVETGAAVVAPAVAADADVALAPAEVQEDLPAPVIEVDVEVEPAPVEAEVVVAAPAVEAIAETVAAPAEVIEAAVPQETERAQPDSVPVAPRGADSMAFPVLPTPPVRTLDPEPAPAEPPPAEPAAPEEAPAEPPPSVTPSVRSVSRPRVTPTPITLGPYLASPPAAARRRQRRSFLLFGSLGVLAAAVVLAIVLPFFFPAREPVRAEARTQVAAPGTVLRYFDGAGVVQALTGPVLKFPAAGVVTRIAKPGSTVVAGDVVAALDAARPLLAQLARLRERLTFHQQIVEAMHQVGNAKEEERQTASVEVRNARIARTLRALAAVAVVAEAAGTVEEVFTREGDTVAADAPALRLRSAGLRATFELPRGQAAAARRLGFCQVEVDGYGFECTQVQERGDENHVSVDIPSLAQTLIGRPARLARVRFEGAVAVPAAVVVNAGRRNEVLLVVPPGRVEPRPVTVAEQNAMEAIVTQGLDRGDRVILDPAPSLRAGVPVGAR